MADKPAVVHIGENSTEEVAFKLYRIIVAHEGEGISTGFLREGSQAGRQYVLDLYAQCLRTVKNP
jgi:hypothetical protein